jgi:magnesium transporter
MEPLEGLSDEGAAAVQHTDAIARTRVYRDGRLAVENFAVDEISDLLSESNTYVWVDLCAPQAHDLGVIAAELGLHEFLNMYAARLDTATGSLGLSELSAFITPRALVTVRKDKSFDMDQVVARWDDAPDLASHGVGFLLHGLIDHVVDGHFEVVQDLDEEIEKLEDLLFESDRQDSEVQRRSFALRKSLVTLRRVVLPMREVVNSLMRRDVSLVDAGLLPYFQDVYDHVPRASEWTESLRDLVTTILETNLTLQGNRLNVITKKVTSWAAIIAVPTAITGFYGQNLPYPGFARMSGLLVSCGLIIGISGGLYVVFKRKDWL